MSRRTHFGLQPPQTAPADFHDSSRIGPDGTAYVTRIVPVPTTISPGTQKSLAARSPTPTVRPRSSSAALEPTNGKTAPGNNRSSSTPVNIVDDKIAGVPVRVVTPLTIAPEKRDRVLTEGI